MMMPEQADDEDDPAPLPPSPSWLPPDLAASVRSGRARDQAGRSSSALALARERVLAWIMLLLGATGVALGCLMPGTTATEVILGAILIVLALRVLFFRGRRVCRL
jgi:hypothetical protein